MIAVLLEGAGFVAVMYFKSQSRHELAVEKDMLENKLDEMVKSQYDLKAIVEKLNKQNRKLRKQYTEAMREYENYEEINDIDTALNSFFDG